MSLIPIACKSQQIGKKPIELSPRRIRFNHSNTEIKSEQKFECLEKVAYIDSHLFDKKRSNDPPPPPPPPKKKKQKRSRQANQKICEPAEIFIDHFYQSKSEKIYLKGEIMF